MLGFGPIAAFPLDSQFEITPSGSVAVTLGGPTSSVLGQTLNISGGAGNPLLGMGPLASASLDASPGKNTAGGIGWGQLSVLTASASSTSGTAVDNGTASATMPMPTASASSSVVDYTGTMAATLPNPSVNVTSTFTLLITAAISPTLAAPSAAATNYSNAAISVSTPTALATMVAEQVGTIETLVLLHCDNDPTVTTPAIPDDAGNTWAIGGAQSTSGASNFKNAYLLSSSTIATGSVPAFTSSDFTLECRFKINTTALPHYLFGLGVNTTGWAFGTDTSSNFFMQTGGSGGTKTSFGSGGSAATDNNWHHVAFVRTGTSLVCYQDGFKVGSTATLSGSLADAWISFNGWVDSSHAASLDGSGYVVDEIRISKIARYSANFAPPTQPFLIETASNGIWADLRPVLPQPTASLAGNAVDYVVAVSPNMPMPVASVSGITVSDFGTANITLPSPNTALASAYGPSLSMSSTLAMPTAAGIGAEVAKGASSPVLTAPVVALSTATGPTVSIPVFLPAPNVLLSGYEGASGSISAPNNLLPSSFVQSFASEQITTFNGAIGEAVVVNRALTDDELFKMQGYLAWKWHRQSLLPDNHPYRWRPPIKGYTSPRYVGADITFPSPSVAVQGKRMDAIIAFPPVPVAAVAGGTNPPAQIAASIPQVGFGISYAHGIGGSATAGLAMPSSSASSGHGIGGSAATTTSMPAANVVPFYGWKSSSVVTMARPVTAMQIGDPYWNNLALLLQADNQLQSIAHDTSPRTKGIQWANIAFDNTTSPYSSPYNRGFAMKFNFFGFGDPAADGCFYTDSGITSNASDFNFGTGDFTFELWLRHGGSNFGSVKRLLDQRVTGVGSFYLEVSETTGLITNGALTGTTSTSIMDGSWHHIAYSRVSGTLRSFVDGQLQQTGTWTNAYDIIDAANGGFMVIGGTVQNYAADLNGTASNSSHNWTGWMDDIRITKGVGRYTANFALPIQPYSAL